MARATQARKSLSLKGKFSHESFFGTSQNLPKLVELDMSDIEANPDQPRRYFSDEAIEELAQSISRYGLLQPILVARQNQAGGRPPYLIVAGERRFRACKVLGHKTMPVIMTDGHDQEISLIENLQRQDLNPVEEAEAIARLMDERGYTQESVGGILGKKQNTMSAMLSIVGLSEPFRKWARQQPDLRRSILIELARLPKDLQPEAEAMIRAGEASVKRLRDLAKPETADDAAVSDVGLSEGRPAARARQVPAGQALVRHQTALRTLIMKTRPQEISPDVRKDLESLVRDIQDWLDVQ